MIDGQNVFDQPIKVDLRTNHSIRKTAIGQEDGHTTGCLLGYLYFKEINSNRFKKATGT